MQRLTICIEIFLKSLIHIMSVSFQKKEEII